VAAPETQAAAIERLLRSGDAVEALRVSDGLLAKARGNFAGRFGRARALLQLGKVGEADAELDECVRLAAKDPHARLLRGIVDQRLGRVERAIESLRPLAKGSTPFAAEAAIALAETLWFGHRRDELAAMVKTGGPWTRDPRAALAAARLRGLDEPAAAIDALRDLADRGPNPLVRRVAGFEAVGLLDRTGRYREAFDLATALHAATTAPFDLDGMLLEVERQRKELDAGRLRFEPRIEPVRDVALVVGLPRSGTTLLEQMLDGHSAIAGIGEYDGIETLADELVATGRYPRSIGAIAPATLEAARDRYRAGARRLARAGATFTFDKTLRAWNRLPAVAAALPGAVCFRMTRDPRDQAISIFLSYFHPIADGWTSSLESIRRVIEAERSILPRALEALDLPHESLSLEELVAEPEAHANRCLSRLGLALDSRVLRPEANPRTVFTLSHEQVRRPINRAGLGRSKNYEFAFGAAWDALEPAR
jgi:tetratricopeptide (TPR) repeat protein